MADSTPELSVVTALFNRLDLTCRFLEDLEGSLSGVDYEVVFVDDGSTDGTRDFLQRENSSKVRFFPNERNLGFAASNNRGVREARAPVIALLNNDLVLRPGWFEPMREEMRRGSGFVGNVQTDARTGRIDHAGIVFTPWGIPEHWGQRYLRVPRKGARRFRAVTAACALIERTVFLREGSFDESFRNGFEDIDFCLRLDAKGMENRVVFESRVGHWVSASPGRKESDAENIRRFLTRWGEKTSDWGLGDWPKHYLRRHLRCPWRLNGPKTLVALRMLSGLKTARPEWMRERFESLRARGVPDA